MRSNKTFSAMQESRKLEVTTYLYITFRIREGGDSLDKKVNVENVKKMIQHTVNIEGR